MKRRLIGRASLALAALMLLGAGGAGLWHLGAADLGNAPKARDRQVTIMVSSLLRRDHLSKHPIDDEISQRGIKQFLKALDPMKLYFLQSDVDEFLQKKNELDDLMREGDISFGYTVFKRYLQRVDERLAWIEKLVTAQHDFDVKEEVVVHQDAAQYSKTEADAFDRWRKRIKYDLLILKGDKVADAEARDRLLRRYRSFGKRMHQTDSDELLEMYLTSLTSSFDPHTTYMSPNSLDNFIISMSLQLEGIGAALQLTDGYTVVSKIIPGGAADKDGRLKPEDRIVSVGQGKDAEMVEVLDMKLNDVVDKVRGKAGTIVRLGVISPGTTETKFIEITRAKIELTDSEARGAMFDDIKKADGSPLKIGVIDLPSFYMDMDGAKKGLETFKSTTRDVRKLLEDFNSKGVEVVVLDLRHNGGGSLTEAINLTGLFIDHGPVVQVKDPDGRVQHYDDLERGMAWDGPLIVLTSKFSASASEILAGAIQDYQRGLIVGDSATHGKGTVQSMLNLGDQLFRNPAKAPNLGALKITMQQFYRPNGDSTQQRGVLADVVLPSITDHMDVAESDLDYALAFDKVASARYGKYDLVSPEIVARLRTDSQARVTASDDFKKLAKSIDRYREAKAKKVMSVNATEFFAARSEINAEKEEEKQFEKQANGKTKDEVVKRDFYMNEVLAIATEYAASLKTKKLAKSN
ncbi:MAG TPA: carboxy terminal-processing peptidase [Pirellulaceae bacterium]|nr:carboxy terminal-processing peptidase [Pirellulaceae bacterium]